MSTTQVKINVPGNHLMAPLLGSRRRAAPPDRGRLPRHARIHVRGNEIAIDGDDAGDVGAALRGAGAAPPAGPAARAGHRSAAPSTWSRPTRARPRCSPPRCCARAGAARSARRRRARSATSTPSATTSSPSASARPAPASAGWRWPWPCRRCRPSRSTASSSPGPAVEAGERLGFLPGDLMAKVDPYLRPLYDALYDMVEPEGAPAPARAGRGRGRAAGLHAGPHAQLQLHHPRRGPEHHARADEDVPHPHRLRLARPSSPATPPRSTCPAGAAASTGSRRILADIDGPRLRAPRPARRRPPPHRAGHRRRLRAG